MARFNIEENIAKKVILTTTEVKTIQNDEENFYHTIGKDSHFNIDEDTKKISKLTVREANEKLAELVCEVYSKIGEAQSFSDEHGLSFNFSVEYGMGGYYEEGVWYPSSQSC